MPIDPNSCQNSDHGIQTFSARNLVFIDNIIQHLIQWGEFSTPFSGENSVFHSVWGEFSTPFSGETEENSARVGLERWSGTLDSSSMMSPQYTGRYTH